uniref:Penicillin-binding protein 2 n=1 Tax=Desulfobacca acetoxidans TaxID=60893 RepID=A0A7C3Z4J3_9BACT
MKLFEPTPSLEYPYQEEPLGDQMTPEELERSRRLLARVAPILLLLFGLLVLRLWYLQLIKGEYLQKRSEYNRIRVQEIPPWRGMILDRDGNILVGNRHSFNLMASLEDIPDPDLLARRLGSLLHLDANFLVTQIDKARRAGLTQVRLKSQLSWEEMALVETYKAELPGVAIMIASKREYHQPALASHLLGYLGEITEAQLKSGRYPGYKMGDYLGRSGIEAAWEDVLRGQQGSRRIEVDAFGRELGELDQTPSLPGANVYLTIDTRLQQEAENLLEGKVGAIVALNPQNGKILAMASSPTFSQDIFDRGVSAQEWQKLLEDKNHPLLNRTIKGQYPPGSTFKIVMAVAGLEEKVITPQTYIHCRGSLRVGNHEFSCWRKRGHGSLNLHQALVQSCDVYFYEVGRRLGIERIAKWCKRFGLGSPSGLKLGGELPGLVGGPAWKRTRFKAPWTEGDTVNLAIGQGYNLTTPLQVARMAATLANGGTLFQPQLVEKVETPAGEVLYRFQPKVQGNLGADPANLEMVRQALVAVVRNGTGKRAYLGNVDVAGKTGTSQVVSVEKEKAGKTVHKFQNHAWFVAYAPADDPQVVVSVIVEHGGGGGEVAAPLARRFLASYFANTRIARNR